MYSILEKIVILVGAGGAVQVHLLFFKYCGLENLELYLCFS